MAKKWPAVGTPVAVHWDDASDHDPGWKPAGDVEVDEGTKMVSYGVFLGVKKRYVLLAGTFCPLDNHTNTTGQIPVGCVTKVAELRETDAAEAAK
jgi:hypothetical protein